MSGLNQQFAKLRGAERCPEGSNPSLTAKYIAGIQGIGQSHKLGLVGSNPAPATNLIYS